MQMETVGNLFNVLFADLRGSKILFEDLATKAEKLSRAIESAAVASHVFLDAFQKVADAAISAKGATRELGTALTKMCMRQRAIEVKAADISRSLSNSLVQPMTQLVRDWEKTTKSLEADHERESRKAMKSAKRAAQITIKKVKESDKMEKKGKGSAEIQDKKEESLKAACESYQHLEEMERFWMRKLLIEQRGRYCKFVQCFKPVVECEIALLDDATHMRDILCDTLNLTVNPSHLPQSSEQLIEELKLVDPVTRAASPVINRRLQSVSGASSPDSKRFPLRSSSCDSFLTSSTNYVNGSVPSPSREYSPGPAQYAASDSLPPPPPPLAIEVESPSPPGPRHVNQGQILGSPGLRHASTGQLELSPRLAALNRPHSLSPEVEPSPPLPPRNVPSPNQKRPVSYGGLPLPVPLPQQSVFPTRPRAVDKIPSPLVPLDDSSDDDDTPGENSLLAALKKAKLKKVTTNDRSGPNV